MTTFVPLASGERNLLQRAADIGLPAHLRLLLTVAGADPNAAGKGTPPPLIFAARAGNYDVIEVLRDHKDNNNGELILCYYFFHFELFDSF